MFLCAGIPESGILSASTSSAYQSNTSQCVGAFNVERGPAFLQPSQLMLQTGPPQPMPRDSSIGIGQHIGTDVSYRPVAPPQQTPWAVPGTNVPSLSVADTSYIMSGSLERMSLPESGPIPLQNMSSILRGLVPNVSLHPGFPGSSIAVSSVTSGAKPTFLRPPHNLDMPTALEGPPTRASQLRPPAQPDMFFGQRPLVASVPNSVFPLPQSRAQVVEVFPRTQPSPLAPVLPDNPAGLSAARLPVDQPPMRLLLPPPVLPPPRPPVLLTSLQPPSLPVAVGTPLAVVQETRSVELQPVSVLPVRAPVMVEPPPASVHMPRPNLLNEQSAVKLPSSPLVGLMPSFPPLETRLAPRVILQEVPNRPSAMVQTPSLAPPTGEMLVGQQHHAVSSIAPGQIRPPMIPQSLLNCQPVGRQLPAPKFGPELAEVQSAREPQNSANLKMQDTSYQASAQLHSLPNPTDEILQTSDRPFSMPSKPLMAPWQILEALQGLSAPQGSHLLGEPSREALQMGLSPIRVSDLRPQELCRAPMQHDDLSKNLSLGRLDQHVSSFSGSNFGSRLPAPAVVMASSQIIRSQMPDDRFQSEFRHHDFGDQQESDTVDGGGARVRSLLDENLLKLSQSSSGELDIRASTPRQWKDRNSDGTLTVGALKAAMRQRDDTNRRRPFHRSGAAEDCSPRYYEPPSKFRKSAEDTAAELDDMPQTSVVKCDSRVDKDAVSSNVDAASVAVAEPSSSNSPSESS